jgi:hypothetical protein
MRGFRNEWQPGDPTDIDGPERKPTRKASMNLRDIRKALPPLPGGPSDAPYPYRAEFLAGYTHCCKLVDPIREQLEGLVREWREATVGIGNYGTMRPLNEIEKAIARACADQLEALVGAVGEKK